MEDGAKAFEEAFKKAAAAAAEALKKALNTIITEMKAELTTEAEKASQVATEGVGKLKTVLEGIPPKIKSVIDMLCEPLPGDDLKATCKTGATEIVKTASSVLGSLCTKGVEALIKLGKEACVKASEAASAILQKASGFCTSATSALPATTAQPLTEACISVTGELLKLPGEVCDFVMGKAETLGKTTCDAITSVGQSMGLAKRSLVRTALAAKRLRNRFERAYFTKLDALSDFIPKLQKAIEDAKTALLKIKDEAMAKAATIVAKSVAEVLKKAIQPVKEALMKAADAAVELAKQGLTGLTGVLGQIPTKVQGALTEACGALPGGDELKGVCTAGLADVIKKATEVLGKVCTAGTTALIGEATKACTTASTKADELLKSADGTPFSSPDCRF